MDVSTAAYMRGSSGAEAVKNVHRDLLEVLHKCKHTVESKLSAEENLEYAVSVQKLVNKFRIDSGEGVSVPSLFQS